MITITPKVNGRRVWLEDLPELPFKNQGEATQYTKFWSLDNAVRVGVNGLMEGQNYSLTFDIDCDNFGVKTDALSRAFFVKLQDNLCCDLCEDDASVQWGCRQDARTSEALAAFRSPDHV